MPGKIEIPRELIGEYRISKTSLILGVGSCILLTALGVLIMHVGIALRETADYLIFAIGLLFATASLIGGYACFRTRIIIDDEGITHIGVFRSKTFLWREISGYRRNKKCYLTLVTDNNRVMDIDDSFKDFYFVDVWVSENYPDLVAKEERAERREILHDKYFGKDTAAVAEKVKRWTPVALTVNAIGTVIALSAFFTGFRVMIVGTILMIIPAILVYHLSRGLVKTFAIGESVFSSMEVVLFFIGGSLAYIALDEPIAEYTNLAIYTAALAAIISILLLWHDFRYIKRETFRFLSMAGCVVIFAIAYSFGSIVYLNDMLDKSKPNVYEVRVTGKYYYESSGKHKTSHYDVHFTGWERGGITECDQGKAFYNSVKVGDTLDLRLYPGYFNIPYYFLHTKE